MNKGLLVAGLAGIVVLVLLFASGFGRDTRAIQSPLIGREAPAFTLARVDGQGTFSLAQLHGRPAVVNFWATWCQPCMEELDSLQQTARLAGDVQFVGIVYEDEPARIADVLARHGGSSYPTLVDEGGRTAIAYGVGGIPETFFLDANGRIVDKYAGPLSTSRLTQFLARLRRSRS